ncbi:hypothetical protein CTEN210_13713 [Chaetoceros tenuissimus]|uniref:RRM domain-containing protein n=1 Tax=Chaetoceros tenuissimus TaxID=426638 RepID=A0AAD3D3J1_9STRA|nr:hypothetical protein CTEN210_13713 [Chaetoceros tenuissimus]
MAVKRRIGDLGEKDELTLHFYKDLAEPLDKLMQLGIENLSPHGKTKIESLLLSLKDMYKTKAMAFLSDIKEFVPTDHSDANDGSASLEPDNEDGSSVEEGNIVMHSVTVDSDDDNNPFGEEGQDFESIVHLNDSAELSTGVVAVGQNRKNMVNISGLDYKLTEAQIKEFFESKCGQIEKVLVSKFNKGPTNCGWACITFENEEAMEKCIKLHGEELQGRDLIIKRASQQTGTVKSVFCTGFNLNGKEEIEQALRKSFENIDVPLTFTEFHIRRKCAFVHFESSLHADSAVQSSGFQLENGQAVMVDYNLKKINS